MNFICMLSQIVFFDTRSMTATVSPTGVDRWVARALVLLKLGFWPSRTL